MANSSTARRRSLKSGSAAQRESAPRDEAVHSHSACHKQDVNDVWDYIRQRQAADRVLEALEQAMLQLAKSPGIGHRREELMDKRHRFFQVYSYLIVYRHETKPLQIIRASCCA